MDTLSEAIRFLEEFESTSDSERRIRKFEAGMNLLNGYVQNNPDLDEDTQQRIRDVRASYTRKLLISLSDVRGGSIEPWLEYARVLVLKMKPELDALLEDYSRNAMLFPRPPNGAVVEISPPGLAWLPVEGASTYHLEIRCSSGALVYERTVGNDPVHLPDRVLPPGVYIWEVIALDAQGKKGTRRGELSFTIAENAPELPWVEPRMLLAQVPREHPRFLYLRQDLPSIRATLRTTRKRSWRACLNGAEHALKVATPIYPSYHLTKNRVQSRLEYKQYVADFERSIDRALTDLCLTFLMTEEEKYAEAAKRLLLEVVDWPTDDDDVTSVSARWGDGLGLSLARCGHRAYDWLYEALSDEERVKVLAMCEARAWQTYRRLLRYNYMTYPGESHNGRLIAYLAEMAIVMAGESEGARTWLDYSLKALTTFYPHWGGHEGGWAEGTAYGLWYNMLLIPACETLRITTGFDLWQRPFFRKVRYFFFYCTALRGEISPFGDGAETVGPGIRGGSGYALLLWYHAHRFNDPYIGWWVNQIEGWDGSSRELSLMFEDTAEVKQPTHLPGSCVFRGVGWAALHGDLSRPDEDTFLLFKSSPYGSVSHSHADQNAFCIMKGGQALAIPSGYYWPWAGMPHHTDWTCSTRANNCVLVNGEGQAIRERRANGRITAFEGRKGLSYVAGDAAAAYWGRVRRFNRHILFLHPGLFLLLDDLETPEPARFQWMLHAFEQMEVDEAAGRVISRRRGATLDLRLHSPLGLMLSQTDQFDTPCNTGIPEAFQEEMPNHWHVTAETAQTAGSVRIGAVMAVWGPDERFELEVSEQSGWFGARATGMFGTVEGWVQLEPHTPGPQGYGEAVVKGKAILCGRSVDGDRLSADGIDVAVNTS